MSTQPVGVLPLARLDPPAQPVHRRSLRGGWPLSAVLLLYPVWWALGLGVFIWILVALPMGWYLLRKTKVRVPAGFGVWVLFLVFVVMSTLMLGLNPPGTVPDTVSSRLVPTALRLAEYLSVTVLLLYIGNLDEAEYPRRRLIRELGVLFLWTVLGGLIGVVRPTLQFVSPVELLLSPNTRENPFVQSLVHPAFAQLHEILGFQSPRPAAPFGYTNTWGNNLAILLVWFAAGWLIKASPSRRWLGYLALALAVVPVAYSLNRGLWIGLLLCVLYVAIRLIVRGRMELLGALAGVVALMVVVVSLSPLQGLITARLDHGKSNDVRAFSVTESLRIAKLSPLLGYGQTRNAVGSELSSAIGKTAACPRCGNIALGSNGQLWLVLVTTGFIGAGLYVGFFLHAVWHYRRDATVIGFAGVLAISLQLFFMFVYNAMVSPLALSMISLALLWRNEQYHAAKAAEGTATSTARLSA